MGGGMDIDWNYHDRVLTIARKKFGHLSIEELEKTLDDNTSKISALEEEQKALFETIHLLRLEEEEMYQLWREKKRANEKII